MFVLRSSPKSPQQNYVYLESPSTFYRAFTHKNTCEEVTGQLAVCNKELYGNC